MTDAADRRWRVLTVVLIAEAMDILDTTTVNVAGPSVSRSLGGGRDPFSV